MKIAVRVNGVSESFDADKWHWIGETLQLYKDGCDKCQKPNEPVAEFNASLVESVQYVQGD